MKKRSMLFALFLLITVAGNAQTVASSNKLSEKSGSSIHQTVATVAPHIPSLTKYDGKGIIWHGPKDNYTMESQDRIKKWAKEYPQEKTKFFDAASQYLNTTKVSELPANEAEKYYDLKAKWMMVAQL